jgi:hypothetical protein
LVWRGGSSHCRSSYGAIQYPSRAIPGAPDLLRFAERLGRRMDERADLGRRRVRDKPQRPNAIKKHEWPIERRAGQAPGIDADRTAIGVDPRADRGQAKRVLGLAAEIVERRRGRIQRGLVGGSELHGKQPGPIVRLAEGEGWETHL